VSHQHPALSYILRKRSFCSSVSYLLDGFLSWGFSTALAVLQNEKYGVGETATAKLEEWV
jgi:hypothetical protein